MFTTFPWLSSRAGHPALCTRLPVKRGRRGLRGAKRCEELALWRCAGRYTHERGAESHLSAPAHRLAVCDASARLRLLSSCRRATRV